MRTLISIGIALVVTVLQIPIGNKLTPELDVEMAGGILLMAFIGTAASMWLLMRYKLRHTAMGSRLLISVGVGAANLVFLYLACSVPNPRMFVKDAAIEIGLAAFIVSVATLALLSWPPRLTNESDRSAPPEPR